MEVLGNRFNILFQYDLTNANTAASLKMYAKVDLCADLIVLVQTKRVDLYAYSV